MYLSDSELDKSMYRSDKGKRHEGSKWGKNTPIYCFDYKGDLVGEFRGIYAAIDKLSTEDNPLTYIGIYQCLMNRQRRHGNYIWKSPFGIGRGRLVLEKY